MGTGKAAEQCFQQSRWCHGRMGLKLEGQRQGKRGKRCIMLRVKDGGKNRARARGEVRDVNRYSQGTEKLLDSVQSAGVGVMPAWRQSKAVFYW